MTRMSQRFHFSPWPILMTLSAIALAVGVFLVTQSVQQREAHVAELNRQLLTEQQTMRVLDAEWAYLTRPQRLEELIAMKRDREVMPPTPTPIASFVPETPVSAPAVAPEKIETVEPAAGAVEKPVPVKRPVKQASLKKDSKPAVVKKEASKAVTKKAAPQKAAAKEDYVFPIKRSAARAQVTQSYRSPQYPARAGVARPIVE